MIAEWNVCHIINLQGRYIIWNAILCCKITEVTVVTLLCGTDDVLLTRWKNIQIQESVQLTQSVNEHVSVISGIGDTRRSEQTLRPLSLLCGKLNLIGCSV